MNPKFQAALVFHQRGELDRAAVLYQEILQSEPGHVESLHLLGVVASQLGNHVVAVDLIVRAIKCEPDNPHFHFNLGVSLEELGRIQEAADSYGRAGSLDAGHAEALLNRGNCLFRLGDQSGAEMAYRLAISARPAYAAAHSNLGNLLQETGNLDEALSSHVRAVELGPEAATYHFNLANVLKEFNQLDAALASYDRALGLEPHYVAAWGNKSGVLMDLGRFEEALFGYERSIALQPQDAKGHSNRGNALVALRRLDHAIASFERSIEIDPDDPQSHMNMGNALIAVGRSEAAIECLMRAVSIDPGCAEAYSNLGSALKAVGRFSDAFNSYDHAIRLEPALAEAHWNKGLTQLLLGDFGNGWCSYEWRWKTKESLRAGRHFAQPLWVGQEPLAGKTILVHCEQGLGDTIQFCRYLPLLAAQGASVVFELPQVLLGLLQNLSSVDRFILQGVALPRTDIHCPLLSLPLAFKSTPDTFPSRGGYLEPEPLKLARWSDWLGEKTKPRIGLVWSGNEQHKNDHNRSIPLASMLPHLPAQFEYVSLQREVKYSDQCHLGLNPQIRHVGAGLEDFTDTAALCSLMDLVISVDTSVAHLSGALGLQTWVLLPNLPDWRWLLNREDSPWYSTARLYRQAADRDWGKVLARVSAALNDFECNRAGK
jgi:tetratricopeptide (TPR) repeat protein